MMRTRTGSADLGSQMAVDAEVMLAEVTSGLAETLAQLEPLGPGNPEPTLLVRAA